MYIYLFSFIIDIQNVLTSSTCGVYISGVYIAALDAVPAAIYCFLRAAKPIEGLEVIYYVKLSINQI